LWINFSRDPRAVPWLNGAGLCASVYGCRVDSIAGLLDSPRARGAFLLRSRLRPPWSLRIVDEAPLSVAAVVRGSMWVVRDAGEPVHVGEGDVAIFRGPEPYVCADDPATEPQVEIHPGQVCRTPDGREVMPMSDLGTRLWGNDPNGPTELVTGTYQVQTAVSRRLLDTLPPLVVIPAEALRSPLVGFLADEIVRDEPGQEAVLDRLLDLLLVATLRAWYARPDAGAPGWYRANGDPIVGPALRLLHHRPADPWTVEALAAATGVSRAALARRFTSMVGEPPMAFLTGWRLTLAADLLREPGATVESVARQVGYGSSFALSTAFKRVRGVTPREHRAAALAS
jgi:AraC-like DNA-binding protein